MKYDDNTATDFGNLPKNCKSIAVWNLEIYISYLLLNSTQNLIDMWQKFRNSSMNCDVVAPRWWFNY